MLIERWHGVGNAGECLGVIGCQPGTNTWRRDYIDHADSCRARRALGWCDHGDDGNGLPVGSRAVYRVTWTRKSDGSVEEWVRLARTHLWVAIDRSKAGLLGIPTVEMIAPCSSAWRDSRLGSAVCAHAERRSGQRVTGQGVYTMLVQRRQDAWRILRSHESVQHLDHLRQQVKLAPR